MKVENKTEENLSIYPDQSIITTNTKEQKEANIFISDDVGGDFLGQVIKEGNVIFLLDSKAEDLKSAKLIINAPVNEDFDTLGEKIEFDINF